MHSEKNKADDVSQRITDGMQLVFDLFNEMDSLMRLIKDGLANSGAALTLQGPKSFILPRGRRFKNLAERFVKPDMGLLVALDSAADADEFVEDSDEEEESSASNGASVEIADDTRYLGIRAILYATEAPDPRKAQPVLVAAVLSDFSACRGGSKKKKAANINRVRKGLVKRLLKKLDRDLQPGSKLAVKGVGSVTLEAMVESIHIVPIVQFTSEEEVGVYVEKLVQMTGC